jgi:integrase
MEWYNVYGEPNWPSQNTKLAQLTNINRQIIPVFGDYELEKIKPVDIQTFYNNLIKKGYKPSTVHKFSEALRQSLKKAFALDMIPKNPCDNATLPPKRQDEVRHLSEDEMKKLDLALPESTTGRACGFILMTGMRAGEMAGLRWGDIDMENEVMQIRRSVNYQKTVVDGVVSEHESLVVSPVKTRKGFREITLLPEAIELLNQQRAQQGVECKRAGRFWQGRPAGDPETYVFASTLGTAIQRRVVQRALDGFRKKAGLEHVTLHPLRHSALTQMSVNGVDPKTLSEIAGHSNVSFTMQVYCHSSREAKRKAFEALGRVFDKSKKDVDVND